MIKKLSLCNLLTELKRNELLIAIFSTFTSKQGFPLKMHMVYINRKERRGREWGREWGGGGDERERERRGERESAALLKHALRRCGANIYGKLYLWHHINTIILQVAKMKQ